MIVTGETPHNRYDCSHACHSINLNSSSHTTQNTLHRPQLNILKPTFKYVSMLGVLLYFKICAGVYVAGGTHMSVNAHRCHRHSISREPGIQMVVSPQSSASALQLLAASHFYTPNRLPFMNRKKGRSSCLIKQEKQKK